MTERTNRMKFVYPSLDAESWYDTFEDLVEAFDAELFAPHDHLGGLAIGGGTVSWNLATETLSWTGNIVVMVPTTGLLLRLSPGSLSVLAGDFIFIELEPGAEEVAEPSISAFRKVDVLQTVKVIGFRDGDTIKLRSGVYLDDGDSVAGITM